MAGQDKQTVEPILHDGLNRQPYKEAETETETETKMEMGMEMVEGSSSGGSRRSSCRRKTVVTMMAMMFPSSKEMKRFKAEDYSIPEGKHVKACLKQRMYGNEEEKKTLSS